MEKLTKSDLIDSITEKAKEIDRLIKKHGSKDLYVVIPPLFWKTSGLKISEVI